MNERPELSRSERTAVLNPAEGSAVTITAQQRHLSVRSVEMTRKQMTMTRGIVDEGGLAGRRVEQRFPACKEVDETISIYNTRLNISLMIVLYF